MSLTARLAGLDKPYEPPARRRPPTAKPHIWWPDVEDYGQEGVAHPTYLLRGKPEGEIVHCARAVILPEAWVVQLGGVVKVFGSLKRATAAVERAQRPPKRTHDEMIKTERNTAIFERRNAGERWCDLAKAFGISSERVRSVYAVECRVRRVYPPQQVWTEAQRRARVGERP
jgi:hypothetical protein